MSPDAVPNALLQGLLGTTRGVVTRDHALITPDTFVPISQPSWVGATVVIHTSPEIGAAITSMTVQADAGARGSVPTDETIQRFVFVEDGVVDLCRDYDARLETGSFAYLPPAQDVQIQTQTAATLWLLESRYVPLGGTSAPEARHGNVADVEAVAFQGDEDARLQTLLPDDPAFDFGVNLFAYQPGATLPQVEIHVMEHAMKMLQGAGVYRLGDAWYPVMQGDAIWIGPYCPQWFVAMGKEPARYIYSKEMNRPPGRSSETASG